MSGIKETREALKVLKSLTVRTVKALQDDGKIGVGEGLGFVADIILIIDGLKGSGQILSEMRDLDAPERAVLLSDIRDALIAAGITHRNADIAEAALLLIQQAVDFALFVKRAPPTALPA